MLSGGAAPLLREAAPDPKSRAAEAPNLGTLDARDDPDEPWAADPPVSDCSPSVTISAEAPLPA